ncbi:GH36-type glycosyl hydrolase domain-containing protein [Dickeya dianthicola]|uniref:GH36-type glycosyl hydrolase domain-containing protein n=1 Tax=Dickeya dianthicola TaxID=204039 RepID=UPI001F61A70D|nr:glucoamylase family protein [Dickeya dianthicola]MCI4205464.1 cyclic beta 1-2 glucan synthetase [Dickeya dianthicola]MCI4211248.1 cyclic beta 1-2 glucan synthetase [Dickeya dianthicola]MCI4222900.1 cyclic beta 1-2 glucan synthetase [Dickeya dianthicola]
MKINIKQWLTVNKPRKSQPEKPVWADNASANDLAIKAELFSTAQMERYGQKLAHSHKLSPMKQPYYLLRRLEDNEAVITRNCYLLNAADQASITPEGEWLLDNYYLIEEQIRMVRHHLPKNFGKGLPVLAPPHDCPRIYDIASEAIAHGDGRWDVTSLTGYIAAYQRVIPLSLGELWALPGMLRLAIVENLRRVSIEVANAQQERNLANSWVTRILECAENTPVDLIMVIADMARSRPPLSSAFVAEMVRRLQGRGNMLALPLTWMEQRLAENGITTDVLIHRFNQQLAASQLSVSNSIAGLRLLGETNWTDFAEAVSLVEQTLRQDPAGVYPNMHFDTRDSYRHSIEVLARYSRHSELEVARHILTLAQATSAATPGRHVGYYLIGEGRPELERQLAVNTSRIVQLRQRFNQVPLLSWLGSLSLLTLALTTDIMLETHDQGMHWPLWLMALPLAVVISQLASHLLGEAVTRWRTPLPLPRMDFSAGIPPECRTMIVIPCLLARRESIDRLINSLEVCHLGNNNTNLYFALLTDFTDSPTESTPENRALLDWAGSQIQNLNHRYAKGSHPLLFYLLHRSPRWNPQQGVWMGYERKRGKLSMLNSWLRQPGGQFSTVVGDEQGPPERVKYVITLDSDTVLPRDTAHKLVATLAHPLNHPVYDPAKRRVVKGYGILQPGLAEEIPRNGQGRYAAICSNVAGNNPYSMMSSDVYQDLFGEGSFVGKGIYDVDTFVAATHNTCPENLVLSHDLLEGCYARSGLLSEVLLYEQYPNNYLTDVARHTRWIRGDWQLLNWLKPRVRTADGSFAKNPLSALSRWKLLDNLRRSLVAPSLWGLLFCALLLVPNPFYWLGILAMTLLLPTMLAVTLDLVNKPARRWSWRHLILAATGTVKRLMRIGLDFAALPHKTGYSLFAILTTLWRLCASHRNLHQWASIDQNAGGGETSPLRFYQAMWLNVVSGLVLIALTAQLAPMRLFFALPIGALWCLAPLLLSWLSRPPPRRSPTISIGQTHFLRQTSREIWAFFDTFTTAKDNWLPPDNYQEIPYPTLAHRTSPTNIGLALMANLTAWDFGYIPLGDVLQRVTHTLDTLDKMAHYRGHLYNWYDTRTLAPLNPRYISSVDSGNMAAHLLTLSAGLTLSRHQPILNSAQMLDGLEDTLRLLETAWGRNAPTSLRQLHKHCIAAAALPPALLYAELDNMRAQCRRLHALCSQEDSRTRRWVDHLRHQLALFCQEWSSLLGWITPDWQAAALPSLTWLAQAKPDAKGAPSAAAIRLARRRLNIITELELRLNAHAHMDFTFLYDPVTSLLSVGYHSDHHKLDSSHYDLLPSEIRLTSFLAIATNQLPLKSWFALGRLFTTIDNETALMSWSGSMFEYLMPSLVMPTYPGSLLEAMNHSAVNRQIDWGKARGVPWGISESGYYAFDARQNYQYRAFGVPGLGLRRGLADDMVIAPYATLMALMVTPQKACENLVSLEKIGARGEYGFYEALDYTPSRLANGQRYAVVRSWMVHHQGMAFQALSHLLLDAPMVDRFMSCAAFQSARLLLQERTPDAIELYSPRRHFESHEGALPSARYEPREFTGVGNLPPDIQLLSNTRYHLMVTQSGGGYSRWNDLALTRWRSDATCDDRGAFCYISDPKTGDVWSNAWQPIGTPVGQYHVIFTDAGAEFRRTEGTLSIKTQIVVSPEDDIELRRVTLLHRGRQPRTLELTTYAEVVLASAASDLAHPAFSNLFVQTELIPDQDAILCHRRPRSPDEPYAWLFHMMVVRGQTPEQKTSFETDRAKFLGRGRTAANALAPRQSGPLSNTAGPVLDPIFAIRQSVVLQPGQPVTVDIVYGVADSRQHSQALLEKYRDHPIADRVFELAWSHSQVVLRQINANEDDATLFNRLASAVLFPGPELRAEASIISRNRRGQPGLWGWAISGDLPIVILNVTRDDSLAEIASLIQAHHYWRLKGLPVDLVILNDSQGGYQQELHNRIMDLIGAVSATSQTDKPGGIFVRNGELLSAEDRLLLLSVAHILLDDRAGGLKEQLNQRIQASVATQPTLIPHVGLPVNQHEPWQPDTRDLLFFNGYGGFSANGREYQITLADNAPTPAPWSNVLANAQFGTVISEAGQAYTWYENAHEYRLTPWENDPVSDGSGEAFYLRDEESGAVWSPTSLPVRGSGHYLTRHGFGYSVFAHRETGIDSELTVLVAEHAPVKFAILTLSNNSGRTRRISATGYVEWTLGESRAHSAMHVVTRAAAVTNGCGVLAHNFYRSNGSERTAFFAVTGVHCSVTGDRREFLGRNGSRRKPAAMTHRTLSDKTGAGLDPCAAVQSTTKLIDGDQRTFVFVLGIGQHDQQAESMIAQYLSEDAARTELASVHRYWHRLLDNIVVDTPDPAVNLLANGWLLYQTLASRIMARSGYYQSGGAFGFRDQLQDTLALSHAAPERLREQILLCASRQFTEGDVQHWWHPPLGNGVRTRCSDDYLWLPFALCHYVETTGDADILEQQLPYLEGRPLQPGEESIYEQPTVSAVEETLWQHGVKAIRYGLRFGRHGLPLMGTGDWNDGMNRVGLAGLGESVWLGFFLYDVLQRFARLAEQKQDHDIVTLCRTQAARLQISLETAGWDGNWYRRGYFDHGEPLGSQTSPECQIDAIAQSWAVLSGAGSPERCEQAMRELDQRLVDDDAGLIKLLTPPFDGHGPSPGYIQGYQPGVRENGGQYTHGALWAVMAFAHRGDTARAWQLWSLINPINHALNASAVERYKVEPYVMAADVYSVAPHTGRGGWSWYTGSAGWAYRLIVEALLGVKRHGAAISVHPLLPQDWPSVSLRYQHGNSHYQITVTRGDGDYCVTLDDNALPDDRIPLVDDGQPHKVDIVQR